MTEFTDWCVSGPCPEVPWQALLIIVVVFVAAGWTLWEFIKLRHH